MELAQPVTIYLEHEDCYKCGSIFGIEQRRNKRLLETGNTFWCPYCGASQCYTETEIQRLKKRLAMERDRTDFQRRLAENAERSRRAVKGHLTRVKKRVGNGICPCCNRTFTNLMRHMKSKHPGYKEG